MIGLILFGPPAVGKMTVGLELQKLTGLRLFHNHYPDRHLKIDNTQLSAEAAARRIIDRFSLPTLA